MLARTPQPKNMALADAIAKAIEQMGPMPSPAPLPQAGTKAYLDAPCGNPRLISSMAYTQNCRCGWPMGAHPTGAK